MPNLICTTILSTQWILLMLLLFLSLKMFGQNPKQEIQEILQKLDAGESIENMVINLSDINFETGTAKLEPVATSYLEKVVSMMHKASNIDLFIKGHADNTGNDALNNRLSLDRATSVQEFLLSRGLDSTRLSVRGFGSSMPVADNFTAEGRARNRRVEMEVLKREEAETIQDIIVLSNKQRIGSMVINYDDEEVRYKQFTSDDTLAVQTQQVDTIYFSNGTVKVFDKKEKFNLAQWWDENIHIFKESASFHRGNFIVGLGLGVVNNIGIGYRNHQVNIPPAMLMVELPIGYNLGVSLSAGTMRWGREEEPGVTYMYYAVGTRVAYHLHLGERLDVYSGIVLNGRMITAANNETLLSRRKIDAGLMLGARYYLNRTFGFFGEIGDENVAYPKVGLVIKFGN